MYFTQCYNIDLIENNWINTNTVSSFINEQTELLELFGIIYASKHRSKCILI